MFMNVAATVSINYHESDIYHSHTNILAFIFCDPQSQFQLDARDCCFRRGVTVICGYKVFFQISLPLCGQFKSD